MKLVTWLGLSCGEMTALRWIMIDIKPNPNHKQYLQTLRKMTPAQRLAKAFELSEFSKQLFIHGLRRRFPDLPPQEFVELLRERLDKCHNRNY
jgi:hypothetical protein